MKYRKLADAAIVAALLLAHAPELLEDALPPADPIALIAPAQEAPHERTTPDNPALGL